MRRSRKPTGHKCWTTAPGCGVALGFLVGPAEDKKSPMRRAFHRPREASWATIARVVPSPIMGHVPPMSLDGAVAPDGVIPATALAKGHSPSRKLREMSSQGGLRSTAAGGSPRALAELE